MAKRSTPKSETSDPKPEAVKVRKSSAKQKNEATGTQTPTASAESKPLKLNAAAAAAPPNDGAAGAALFCLERFSTEHLNNELERLNNLRRARRTGGMSVPRLAVVKKLLWDNGQRLKCYFMNDPFGIKTQVWAKAKEWEKHANIHLDLVSTLPAEIRISFTWTKPDGYWSWIGKEALKHPQNEPTMNLGFEGMPSNDELSRVVLHEFGHALGCGHEHSTPRFPRAWNEQRVRDYFRGPPNNWKDSDIDHNIFFRYKESDVNASRFDKDSIMLYMFRSDFFKDGLGPTNQNTTLSDLDKQHIGTIYPMGGTATELIVNDCAVLTLAAGGEQTFVIHAPTTRNYLFQTVGDSPLEITLFKVVSGQRRELGTSNSGGLGSNAAMDVDLEKDGIYELKVKSLGTVNPGEMKICLA